MERQKSGRSILCPIIRDYAVRVPDAKYGNPVRGG